MWLNRTNEENINEKEHQKEWNNKIIIIGKFHQISYRSYTKRFISETFHYSQISPFQNIKEKQESSIVKEI